jgi:hypothetical protein
MAIKAVTVRSKTEKGAMVLAQHPPYLMSFGIGGLYINECVAVARVHLQEGTWDTTAARAFEAGAFPVRKASSVHRSIREIVNRLRQLSHDELLLLLEGDRTEQAALLWLAACRAYRFIGEFAVEVLNERFLSRRLHITYNDFDNFLAAKAEWSPKLAGLSDSTKTKLRAVLFRLMREAGILSPGGQLLGAILSARMIAMLADNSEEFRYFPGADRQFGGRNVANS